MCSYADFQVCSTSNPELQYVSGWNAPNGIHDQAHLMVSLNSWSTSWLTSYLKVQYNSAIQYIVQNTLEYATYSSKFYKFFEMLYALVLWIQYLPWSFMITPSSVLKTVHDNVFTNLSSMFIRKFCKIFLACALSSHSLTTTNLTNTKV